MRKFFAVLLLSFFLILSLPMAFLNQASADGENHLQKIKDQGVLRVGIEGVYPPFNYHDPVTGELKGVEIDIARVVAEDLGVDVEFIETKWASLLAGLDVDKYDVVINNVSATEERKQVYDFTLPYFFAAYKVVVSADNTDIVTEADMRGKKGSASVGTEFTPLLEERGVEILPSNTFSEAMELVVNGNADLTLNNLITIEDYIREHPEVRVKILDFDVPSPNPICMMVRKGDDSLKEALNEIIITRTNDATLTSIYMNHLGNDFAVHNLNEYADLTETTTTEAGRTWRVIKNSFWPLVKSGLRVTIPLAVISFALGLIIAIITALFRTRNQRFLRGLAEFYIWIFRGTPLLVQLFIVFFGLPKIGLHLSAWASAITALSLNTGAYASESIRAAILSIPKGQWEAARSLGMRKNQVLSRVIAPQTIRIALPGLANNFISLVKDTSLASSVTIVEMFMVSQQIVASTYEPFILYVEVALIYLIMCTILTLIQKKLEKDSSLYLA